MNLTIATRNSKLAIWQTERIKELLLEKFPKLIIDFLEVTTRGDIDQVTPLSSFGNTGVFVKGLEAKILSGEADIAVHSLKDVPSDFHPDLVLAAFPEREDVRDVLVTKNNANWKDLKAGSVIGTSSPARKEQLKLLRPDFVFKDIRGNVDTRVQKVMDGEYDATILATAGLKRLGYEIQEESYFSLDEAVPSPGQGALVVQAHKNNTTVIEMLKQINNKQIEKQVESERRFMQIIGGGCRFPVAAHAEITNDKVTFRAIAHKPNWAKLEKVKKKFDRVKLYKNAEKLALAILKKNN